MPETQVCAPSDEATVNVRVLVVEDHSLMADSLTVALRARGHEVLCASGSDQRSVTAEAADFGPGVVLLDLRLGEDRTAVPLIGPLCHLGARVVVVTGERDRVAHAECVEAGAVGVVHKSEPFDRLLEVVAHVAAHGSLASCREREDLARLLHDHRVADRRRREAFDRLTRREARVLAGLVAGMSAAELADRDFVAISTVRSQIRSVLGKLGVGSQLAAVARARAAGWDPTAAGAETEFPQSWG